MDHRRTLRNLAVAMALVESVMVFATEFWPAALVMAVVFGVCAWRLGASRTGRGPVIGVGLAFLVELLPLPFFARAGLADWAVQGLTAVIALAGVVLPVGLLRPRRQNVTV